MLLLAVGLSHTGFSMSAKITMNGVASYIEEFDYDKFHEAFRLLFEESGFSEHYKAMSK